MCMLLTVLYAAVYRFIQRDYYVATFYIVGGIITFVFWLRTKHGDNPTRYLNVWIVILIVYAIFAWFKTGGISGGGLGYFTGVLLAVIIVPREWRLRLINICLIIQWILVLLDHYAHHWPIWGENEKVTYDYMILSFVNLLMVARLKNTFDAREERSNRFQMALQRINDLQVLSHLPLNSLLEQYLLLGRETLGVKSAFIAQVNDNTSIQVLGMLHDKEYFKGGDVSVFSTKIIETVENERLTLIEPLQRTILDLRAKGALFFVALPLIIDQHVFGVVAFYDEESTKGELVDFEPELLELLQGNIESLINLKYLKETHDLKERALSISEERFKSIYDYADIGICFTNLRGTVIMANNALIHMNECKKEDIIGDDFQKFAHPEDKVSDRSLFEEIISGEIDSYSLERRSVTSTGKIIYVGLTVSVVKNEQGEIQYVVRIVNNITERKQNEREINALNQKLEDQVKELETANIELEAFSYSVSHDLRAPLRAIQGYSRIIHDSQKNNLNEEGVRLLEIVQKNAERMSVLIENLLEIAKISRKPMTLIPVNMSEMLEEILENNDIPQRIIRNEGLPTVLVEPTLLKQALTNLISNAMKFSSKTKNPLIEIGYSRHDDHYLIYIKDNGVGFDKNRYDKLFGVFQRLHSQEEYVGSGVGLAIVHKVITRHGGKIWAESELGSGATFYFTIPRG